MNTRALLPCILSCIALTQSPQAKASLVDGWMIDDFFAAQTVEVSAAAPPTQTGFAFTTAPSAIGGERDLLVTKTAGADGERIRARVNPLGENLLRMTQDETNGTVVVTWDGFDGSSAINASGLGGINLGAGLLDPFFELKLTFSDVGGPIVLQIFEQGNIGNFAQATLTAPGGVVAGSSVLLTRAFSDFVLFGTSSLDAIFGNAGAIAMTIDARAAAQQGWDMRIDYLKTRGTLPIPAPGALALMALGLTLLRRRLI